MPMIAELVDKIRPPTMATLMPEEVFREAFANGDGWAPVQYGFYWALGRIFRPRLIFEIGVLGGASMASILMGAGKDARAIGWDIEGYKPHSNALARHTLSICGVGEQGLIENRNSQNCDNLDAVGLIDLIHVDGDHGLDGALHDLELARRCKARVILFDDMFNTNTACALAAANFIERHGQSIVHHEVLQTTTGLMVLLMAP